MYCSDVRTVRTPASRSLFQSEERAIHSARAAVVREVTPTLFGMEGVSQLLPVMTDESARTLDASMCSVRPAYVALLISFGKLTFVCFV